jgi:two-component system, OmpR family, response regulator TrcR
LDQMAIRGRIFMVRILIVEDDRHFANVLACMLGWDGHEVDVAHNAVEGVSLGVANRPDVVVAAWRLKGEIHGGEVCRRIHMAWPHVKAIVITSHQEHVNEAGQYCKCIAAVLSKPFHRDEILEAVRRAFVGELVFASAQLSISPLLSQNSSCQLASLR